MVQATPQASTVESLLLPLGTCFCLLAHGGINVPRHGALLRLQKGVERTSSGFCHQMQSPDFETKADPFAGAVGIYVPGGTAVLPSSALMLSVPAGLAGCPTIVLATPPRPDGSISPEAPS